jgi:hypothetical protein
MIMLWSVMFLGPHNDAISLMMGLTRFLMPHLIRTRLMALSLVWTPISFSAAEMALQFSPRKVRASISSLKASKLLPVPMPFLCGYSQPSGPGLLALLDRGFRRYVRSTLDVSTSGGMMGLGSWCGRKPLRSLTWLLGPSRGGGG